MQAFQPVRDNGIESRYLIFHLLGGGSGNAPTILYPTSGVGIVGGIINYVSAGDYTIVFNEYMGKFHGGDIQGEATTPSSLAGFTYVFKPYVSSTLTLEFVVYNASQVATDLTTSQYLTVYLYFHMSSV